MKRKKNKTYLVSLEQIDGDEFEVSASSKAEAKCKAEKIVKKDSLYWGMDIVDIEEVR